MAAIKLEGFEDFLKAVQNMPDKMKAKTMREIIAKNLKPVALSIKNQAPIRKTTYKGQVVRKRKDGTTSTISLAGNLRNSIGVKTFGKVEVAGYAGIQNGKSIGKDEKGISKGKTNDGWYGFFLERGTKYIAKNPFISRAASMTVPLAAENMQTDIKNYIVKNAQKLGLDAK